MSAYYLAHTYNGIQVYRAVTIEDLQWCWLDEWCGEHTHWRPLVGNDYDDWLYGGCKLWRVSTADIDNAASLPF